MLRLGRRREKIKVQSASYTDIGGREDNEDFVQIVTADDTTAICCVVADGLGGHGGGRIASQAAAGLSSMVSVKNSKAAFSFAVAAPAVFENARAIKAAAASISRYRRQAPAAVFILFLPDPVRQANKPGPPFPSPLRACLSDGRHYIFLILSTASMVFSLLPNAVSRKYPSPLGPKPDPGVPTTLACSSR